MKGTKQTNRKAKCFKKKLLSICKLPKVTNSSYYLYEHAEFVWFKQIFLWLHDYQIPQEWMNMSSNG